MNRETAKKMFTIFITCSEKKVSIAERKSIDREKESERERKEKERISKFRCAKQQPLPHIEIWDEKNHFLRRQRCRNKKHIPFHFVWFRFRFCITCFLNKFLVWYGCAGDVSAVVAAVVFVLVLLSGTIKPLLIGIKYNIQ